ncbi:hypothetical protein EX30DRAFT_388646 [Ascodesmis nigricans]|uniref:Uncharacterized protein n=1 Tax=Ascodesmis nigricans TaxID=341454 RepID=A0A4S2MZR9_9PEZI|nr:hypothetical protein EX30DRAFT_388646 [Ascodesmis nigricans]
MIMNPTNPEAGETSIPPHSVEKPAARKSSTSSTTLSARGGNIVIHQSALPRPAKSSFSSGSSGGSSGCVSSSEATPANTNTIPNSDSESGSGWQLVEYHHTPNKPTSHTPHTPHTPTIPKTPTALTPVPATPTTPTPAPRNRGSYNFHHHRPSPQSGQPQPRTPTRNRSSSTSTSTPTPHPSYSSDNWRSPQRPPPFSPFTLSTVSPATANRTLFLFLPAPPSPAGAAPRNGDGDGNDNEKGRKNGSKDWRPQLPPPHMCYAQPAFVRAPDPRDTGVRFKVPEFFYRVIGEGGTGRNREAAHRGDVAVEGK